MSRWYYAQDGQTKGPVSFEELQALGDRGELRGTDNVFQEGSPGWVGASTVDGLLRGGLLAPPPLPMPPPLPEAEWDPRMTFRPMAPEATMPPGMPIAMAAATVAYAPAVPPPPTTPLGTILARAFTSNLGAVPIGEGEEPVLKEQGVTEPILQRYLVWRRSVLFVALFVTGLSAILGTINQIIGIVNLNDGLGEWRALGVELSVTGFGWLILAFTLLALYVMPLTAAMGLGQWSRLSNSRRILLWGVIVAFGLPLLFALLPIRWQVGVGNVSEKVADGFYAVFGVGVGISSFFTLMPIVLALIAGIVAGCLRLKSLLPASIIPGWFLVATCYLQALILLVLLITVNYALSKPLLVLAILLWVSGPVVFILFSGAFVRPTGAETSGTLFQARLINLVVTAMALVLFVITLFTSKLGEKYVAAFSSDDGMLTVWKLLDMVIGYLGRSMLVTIVAVDIMMRINLSIWQTNSQFAGTDAARENDRVMGELQKSL